MSYTMAGQIKYICSAIGVHESSKEMRTIVVITDSAPHKHFIEEVVAETQKQANVGVYVGIATDDYRAYMAMNIYDWIAFSDNINAELINTLNHRMMRHREHKAHKTLQAPSP